jgi:aromatic ring-cleaving dioxygenase
MKEREPLVLQKCLSGSLIVLMKKIMEFLETLMKFFNMLIHPNCDEEKPDMYSDAVKVSFRLTVFVFIVVAIARIK